MNENDLEIVKLLFARYFNHHEEAERAVILGSWLYGSPVCSRLNYRGSSSVFVPRLIGQLRDYGNISPDTPALARALERMREEIGVDLQMECDRLIERLRNNRVQHLRLIHRPADERHRDAIAQCQVLLKTAGIEVQEVVCQ